MMKNFTYLKTFFSPFKRPKIGFYIGRVRHGTPYFYPRRWIRDKEKPGWSKAIPRKIGFDFVDLGWKTKWTDNDFRYEWGPLWSFVFFKLQICVFFRVLEPSHYWAAWLYYELRTDKNKSSKERIEECREGFPLLWTRFSGDRRELIDYYPVILKK